MKRTLIVTAHLDDAEIGMGGYIINKALTEKIKVICFCQGRDKENSKARIKAAFTNAEEYKYDLVVLEYYDMTLENVLLKDITKEIEDEITFFEPSKVFTLSENDIHQDHKIVSHATKIACRRSNVEEIYEFETPGSEPYSSSYFDTVYPLRNTLLLKQHMVENYTTENIPTLSREEKFRTVYREMK